MKKTSFLLYFLTLIVMILSDISALMATFAFDTGVMQGILALVGPSCLMIVGMYCNVVNKPKYPILQLIPCAVITVISCAVSYIFTEYYYVLVLEHSADAITKAMVIWYYEIILVVISVMMIIYQLLYSLKKRVDEKYGVNI